MRVREVLRGGRGRNKTERQSSRSRTRVDEGEAKRGRRKGRREGCKGEGRRARRDGAGREEGGRRRGAQTAYFWVHSRETLMASFSFSFQCDATSFASGSSCEGRQDPGRQRELVRRVHRRRTRARTHRVGRREEGLDREEDGADLEGRGPLVLEDVEADAPELVDVRVVDLGEEAHFGRRHRVVFREEQLELELAACRGERASARRPRAQVKEEGEAGRTLEGRRVRARNDDVEVAQVVVVRLCRDAWRRVGDEALRLLRARERVGSVLASSVWQGERLRRRGPAEADMRNPPEAARRARGLAPSQSRPTVPESTLVCP